MKKSEQLNQLGQLKKTSLYEQAVDSLLNYIIANDLKEGDKLPPEAQLKDAFGISRNTLREAIKSLQLIGLIDTKQNSGIVVRAFSINDLARFVPYTLRVEDEQLQQLFEARVWMEYSLLPMIVENRTESDLEILGEFIAEMDDQIAAGREIEDLDYQFHLALVSCCKNSFIINIGSILRDFFSQNVQVKRQRTKRDGKTDQTTNEEHKIIYESVAERNLIKLQKIHKKHLSSNPFLT